MTDKSYPSRASAGSSRTDNMTYVYAIIVTAVVFLLVLSVSVEASYYVYEENAPEYSVNFIKIDPDYPVSIKEFNGTYTKFCVKSRILNTNIPYEITDKKVISEKEFANLKTINDEQCFEVIMNSIIGKKFKYGLNSTEWEYNETAIDTACSGSWDGTQTCAKTYDADWGTYGKHGGSEGIVYWNYTKPTADAGYSLSGNSKWQYKYTDVGGDLTKNATIPESCWELDPLQFMGVSNTSNPHVKLRCWNTTDWVKLQDGGYSNAHIYEEAMWWNFVLSEDWFEDNPIVDCDTPQLPDEVVESLVFYYYHEKDLVPINASLDITFNILNPQENQTDNASVSFDENESHHICMYPGNYSYEVDAFGVYYSDTHSQRSYYVVNGTLTNSTQTVNLYSLNATNSDAVVIYVKDADGLFVEDVYIKVQRYYPGTNTYNTVAYLNTDEDGKDMTYLYLNDVYYKFILEQNSVVMNEISPRTITDTVDDPEEITFSLTGEDIEYFQIGDVSAGCTWNNATFTLRCTVSDSSNLMTESCLKTDKLGILAPETINETCDTGSAVTHIHVIGNNNGTYKYVLTVSTASNDYNKITSTVTIPGPGSDFGEWGLMVAFLIVMVCAGLGMAYPPAGGILAVVGLILGLSINMIDITGASIIGLLIVAFIYLWKGKT